jgi:hypothetical protein
LIQDTYSKEWWQDTSPALAYFPDMNDKKASVVGKNEKRIHPVE